MHGIMSWHPCGSWGYALFAAVALCNSPPVLAADIASDVPEVVPAHTKFVFYLHGRIVEDQGRVAFSEEFGRYEYDAILSELAATPAFVISEVRARYTDPRSYADKVGAQVRSLLEAGVPAAAITVVGASKGAVIAASLASSLEVPGIRYVLVGGCADSAPGWDLATLSGSILWILETSDVEGPRDCSAEFSAAKGLQKSKTVHLNTGLRHGFLYRPLQEWLSPARAWIASD